MNHPPDQPNRTRTTCAYCGVGCGLEVSVAAGSAGQPVPRVELRGDAAHPANHGRLCSKGSALGETLGLDNRLLHPQIGGLRASWNLAIDTIANRLRDIIAESGPEAVAFYVSGQLLTEDYYVANKLMKGFIGAGNIDTNSRLCMSSAASAHKRAFGSDSVPGCYEDLELADLILLTGSNTAWAHPVVYQRIVKAKAERPQLKVVVIDPRRTASCDLADLHLPIAPGSDALLFNGLLADLARRDRLDPAYIAAHTEGFEAALAAAQASAPDRASTAAACGVDEAAIARLFDWFGDTTRVVTLFSQGINQSSSGVDKGNAIINCHLASGKIGKPGAAPFSITGQPNAMGGREVGGMANTLAAHMEYENPADLDRLRRFWDAPALAHQPGLKAVELFQAVADGRVRALWIAGTNPAVSLPEANRVRQALQNCEFLIVSDCEGRTDTSQHAHVLLPAAAWGEKDGTVTNSERRISRQRAFLPLPGEARPDWWIFTQVARALGFGSAFDYDTPQQIFREHARLSSFENDGQRDFDLSGLSMLDAAQYDALQPIQWPVTPTHPDGCARLFSDGRYYTPSGRARLIPITPRLPAARLDALHPFLLNTGRIRDQWHTMTRSGRSVRLLSHIAEPFVEIHPEDAKALGIEERALLQVHNHHGSVTLRAQISDAVQRGQLFAPIHWNDQFASAARIDSLVAAVTDPISGQPEFKQSAVAVEPFAATWHGFVLSREPFTTDQIDYWCRGPIEGGHCHELAGKQPINDWRGWFTARLPATDPMLESSWIEFQDAEAGRYRAARFIGGRLDSLIFIDRTPQPAERTWLLERFACGQIEPSARPALLAARPAVAQPDAGRTICVCFNVGLNTIEQAIHSQRLCTVEVIGNRLRAGTNCGSCLPELRAILSRSATPSAATQDCQAQNRHTDQC